VLNVGLVGDVTALEGHENVNGSTLTWQVYDRLTAYNDRFEPQPELAESWDINSDYTQVRLALRKGVQFHSGRDFTSDDVKYNVLRIRDPKTGAGQFAPQGNWFQTIETPDKYTVILKSDVPRPNVFDFFEYFNIVDSVTMEGPDAKTKMVGTGPFQFAEWQQGTLLRLGRNPSYWQTGTPYVDGILVTILRDQQAGGVQLEAGALHFLEGPSRVDFVRLQSTAGYHAVAHPTAGRFYVIGVNVQKPPFDNKLVRQALNYAVNRQRFVDSVLLGVGQAESLPWLPTSPAYQVAKQQAYTFDLQRARALLEQAGVKDLELDMIWAASAEATAMAQIYQADLASIGVKLNPMSLEPAVFLDQANNQKYRGLYWAQAVYAQLAPGAVFASGKAFNPQNNNSGFNSDQYAQLVSAANIETNATRRAQIYSDLNDLLLDESFAMCLSPAPPTVVMRSNLEGFTFNQHDMYSLANAWLSA
jgi:peptide/nickel transport system substrate-binding protein